MGAGFAVGLLDGGWAAGVARSGQVGGVLTALLAAAVDGVLGLAGGLVLEMVTRLAVWGRLGRGADWARGVSTALAAVAAAIATVFAATGSLERKNRFLAAGVVALVTLVAAGVGVAVAPALARLLSRSRPVARGARRLDPAYLLLAPAAVVAVEVVIMSAVMLMRAPVSSARAGRQLAVVAVEAALLPPLLLWAEVLPVRLRWTWALPLAVCLFLVPGLYLARAQWANNLRFVPWTHIVPALGIAALAVVTTPLLARWKERPRTLRWTWTRLGLAGGGLMLLLTLATAESETARKVTSARTGLVGPTLAVARRALDGDDDGYPRLLGGGDCDDEDGVVHPGVLDFPDDGVDQDCDGKDASMAVLTPAPFAAVPDAVPRDLNLLLVTIDTVRADHLGCYGYSRPTSPNVDALAADGALFVNGWAHAPSTRYSMPAIATGRWPSAITWDESIWWPRIAPAVPTVAEALKGQGYFTAAFYSYEYFSVGDHRGFERGVDLYRADRAALHQAVNGPMESHGSSSREMADDAIAFLESHRQQKFFLWLHFYDPHLSYEPHPEVPRFGGARVDLYDGEIRFTDLHLGRVLEQLRALGLWNRTAVFVTGDHGEGFGEHGVTEHGFDLYAAQTKVPFVARVPGLAPRRITSPAGHADIAPTLLNLARAPQPPTFLGRSLVAELAGAVGGGEVKGIGKRKESAAEAGVFQEVTSERGKKRGLVTEQFHLLWNWTPDNTTECYDRKVDPEERHDLWGRSGAGDGDCRRLKSDLQGLVSALSVPPLPPAIAQKLLTHVFAPGARAPAPANLLDATIGKVITVEGYTVTPASALTAPGTDVELAILFECNRPVPDGWRFFFHMTGPGGTFRNLDHVPVEGAMPPERWRPGQRILDRLRIPFPVGSPRGTYQVVVGLFRGSERLPITPSTLSDGNKALRLASIEVR
jgi:arylsulfatase A-like enzyme